MSLFSAWDTEDVRQIKSSVSRVNDSINKLDENIKPNEYELKIKDIQNENKMLREKSREQSDIIYSLQNINEQLLKYIDNIQEIKVSGGIKASIHTDYSQPTIMEYEIKTIPEIRIARVIKRSDE